MNGKITKYYEYEKTSGRVNIPKSVAQMLNWNHEDTISITIEVINGQKGLFLFKKSEE